METKCNASSLFPVFRSYGFMHYVGVDVVSSAGGLWVGYRKEARISQIFSCNNFIILLVEKYKGRSWYLVLFYGAPYVCMRNSVFAELEVYIRNLDHLFLIMGDFNQVEFGSDKLSCTTSGISGAYDFNIWRISNELVDIPFKGPTFTWCNNRKGKKRVYERIDRALGSKDWFSLFPNTGIKHFPIQISDHAPIELDLNLVRNDNKKPYKIDAWVFDHEECMGIIKEAWKFRWIGTPVYVVARKLGRTRGEIKKWAIDKRQQWNKIWDEFDDKLTKGMETAVNEGDEEPYVRANEEVTGFARAAAIFWRQRAKMKWMVEGDTCTKFFFNWVKGRAGRNYILGIKNEVGD
ncbi:uncharacterized protein LOC141594982 [Silene latifolia]|uniref:uncharacterized protein LOC141594982 n=1 Tax=Silene latifolia TaxID=37657 RepID=UPI003D7847CD